MSRKERRAAGKLGNSGKRGAETGPLLDSALRQHQAGQLGEAERLARQILAVDPHDLRALQLLGIIALQTGRNAAAAELFAAALAHDDRLSASHFNLAYALRALGRLAEAEAHYRRAIVLAPNRADIHVNLGNLLLDQSRLDEAADAYRRALAIEDTVIGRYNLANVLLRQRRLDEAVAQCERGLARDPAHALTHNNLGIARREQGDLDAALAQHERAAALDPTLAAAQLGIGNVLGARGDPAAAAEAFRRAIALRPDYAEAHNNLGATLTALGRTDEAALSYRRALAATPPFAEARVNLARLLLAEGQAEDALTFVREALASEDSSEAKILFVRSVRGAAFTADDGGFRSLMLRALREGWGRPAELAHAALSLLRLNRPLDDAIHRAAAAWPARLEIEDMFGLAGFAAMAGDELLRALLETAPVPDVSVERFLTSLRASMLSLAVRSFAAQTISTEVLELCCALARNCFINEYAFACSEDESGAVERLGETLTECARSGAAVAPVWISAVAAYRPLHSLRLEVLLDRNWPLSIEALLTQQIGEPREEESLRAAIPRLTLIEDDVSMRVKEQYEQNPYPRWVAAAAVAPRALDTDLKEKFPQARFRPLGRAAGLDILIAGCGTGQHAIETTRQFTGARTLAVDLSRASLAYAMRMTRPLGLPIAYAEADILKLDEIGRSFDVIEASGVLHHLADPLGAWRRLLALLRPGGVMNVGLYSELGRRHVLHGRAFIAAQGHVPTADGIRQCRQDIMARPDDPLLREIAGAVDFFSLSGCRDLLFHVQEHRLTLPEIGAFIAEEQLTFIGFETSAAVQRAYRTIFPNDPAMIDLDQWHAFEVENPRAFSAMYQFWVQKP